jgi:hypothetical protein
MLHSIGLVSWLRGKDHWSVCSGQSVARHSLFSRREIQHVVEDHLPVLRTAEDTDRDEGLALIHCSSDYSSTAPRATEMSNWRIDSDVLLPEDHCI